MSQLTQQTMTIRQISDLCDVSIPSVTRAIREHYPNLMRDGVTTFLNKEQATFIISQMKIKGNIQPSQNDEVSVPSSLDMLAQMVKVLQEQEAKQKETDRRLVQLEAKIETKFTSEFEDQLVTPTELGQMFTPKLTAQATNKLLQDKGFQYKVGKAWVSSVSGNPYSYNEPIQKEGVGMVYQLKWQRKVAEILK